MLAILSNTIENASNLSDRLQCYWMSQGVYASISIFENTVEFMEAMGTQPYECVILERVGSPINVVNLIQNIYPLCKIAVVTDTTDTEQVRQTALGCYNLGVKIMLTLEDFDRPLAKLSKQLKLI